MMPEVEVRAQPATDGTLHRALLLVGSAKARGTSTSEAIGRVLLEQLATRGIATSVVYSHVTGPDDRMLLESVDQCDLIVLSTPLYFDALPSQLVEVLQVVAEYRRTLPQPPHCALAALVNGGTPDPAQARSAIDVCQLVARDAHLAWRGGLAIPEGDAYAGRHPSRTGSDRLGIALALAAEALARGERIPDDAVRLAALPLMPEGRYTLLNNAGWLVSARRNHTLLRFAEKPFEE